MEPSDKSENTIPEYTTHDRYEAGVALKEAKDKVKLGEGDKYQLNASMQAAKKLCSDIVSSLRSKFNVVNDTEILERSKFASVTRSNGDIYITGGKGEFYKISKGVDILRAVNSIEKNSGEKVPQSIIDSAIKHTTKG